MSDTADVPADPFGVRWTWDQPVALRWLLVDEYSDARAAAVASCHDIVGLFADRPLPPRERYTLLGWRPGARLTRMLSADPTPWLGNVLVGPSHRPGHLPTACVRYGPDCDCVAELLDVTVVGTRSSPRGDGLLDVELSGLVDLRHPPGPPPDRPDADGFRIADDTGALGACDDVTGVYQPRPEPAEVPAVLVGCRPEPPLLSALTALERPGSAAWRRSIAATVLAVEADGSTVSTVSRSLFAKVVEVRPSAVGIGLVDVVFDGGFGDPMPAGAREIWDLRYHGGPNPWARYDRALRHEWCGAALARHRGGEPDRPAGSTYHLDGRFVTDVEGFYCAIGEAVNGPGGYFGWNLDALHDCLTGRWGATTPFRLVWQHSEVARRHLVPGYDRLRWRSAVTMDYLLDMLAELGVEVELR